MPTTYYHTINGRIVGQKKDGMRTHYVPDALGSVVATLDANGTVENTYRYKPYGSLLAKTGTGEDPRFLWVGNRGYRSQIGVGSCYMRARQYGPAIATFFTSVPIPMLRTREHLYGYAFGNPTSRVDPSGLKPCSDECCSEDYMRRFLLGIARLCSPADPKTGGWTKCPEIGTLRSDCAAWKEGNEYTCDWLERALIQLLKLCVNPPGPSTADKADGYTVCCQDKMTKAWVFCGIYCCTARRRNPCIEFCLVRHEEYHEQECKNRAPGAPDNYDESCSYLKQVKCMNTIVSDCFDLENPDRLPDNPAGDGLGSWFRKCKNKVGKRCKAW